MSFREWLPITGRNRVALCLSVFSLVLFLGWNCMPYYESIGEPQTGITATVVWPELFSAYNYLDVISQPDVDGFLVIAAFIGIILNGLIVLLAVPIWQVLHASKFIRLPIAGLTLISGLAITWCFFDEVLSDPAPYWISTAALMSLSPFLLSAAFFLFRNELTLRSGR